MSNSFTIKQLGCKISLQNGRVFSSFLDIAGKQKTSSFVMSEDRSTIRITGLGISCDIRNVPLPSLYNADIRIYGLTSDTYDDLANFSYMCLYNNQARIVLYYNETDDMDDVLMGWENINLKSKYPPKVVFIGDIINAVPVYNGGDSYIDINAITGYYLKDKISPTETIDPQNPVSMSSLFSGWAQEIGAKYEDRREDTSWQSLITNVGKAFMGKTIEETALESGEIKKCELKGSVIDKMRCVNSSFDVNLQYDGEVLALYPTDDKTRTRDSIQLSYNNGLIGYPQMSATGCQIRMLFKEDIRNADIISINYSPIKSMNRLWQVISYSHHLEYMVGSKWETSCVCRPFFGKGVIDSVNEVLS